MKFFRYTILSIVMFTTVFFFTFGPLALSTHTQPRTAHAQSGLISALGSGAAQGLGSCAAAVGTTILSGIASNLIGGLLGGLNPLSVSVTDGGTQGGIQQSTMERTVREGCLDALMYFAAKEVLNQLADSTLEWVESGFTRWGQTDNPGHVRNLGDFLNNTTDSVFNEFYRELARGAELEIPEGSEICGTYRDEVMLALSRTHYSDNPSPTGLQPADAFYENSGGINCPEESLGEEATDAFLSGNFSEGGWDAFAYSVENPDANPVGAYLNQNQRLTQRIQQARELDREELNQGNGWLNAVACPGGESQLDDRTGKCEDGSGNLTDPVVQTPGSVVNDTINNVVGSDFRRLEMADEVNEIVGALVDQMVSGIVGAGGENRQGLFDPELAQRTDTLGNATGNQNDSSQSDYRGRVPEEFINERLNEQLPLEQDLADALDELPSTNEIAAVEARINQCLSDGSINETTNPAAQTVSQQLTTLQQARLGVLPGGGSDQEEDEVGPQKVDWVGNDLSWSQGTTYGIEKCSETTDLYKVSYVPDMEDGNWNGYLCVKKDGSNPFTPSDQYMDRIGNDGSHLGDIEFTDERELYRNPINNYVKVDWNEAEYDWNYYDMFAKEHPVFVTDRILNASDHYTVNNIPEPISGNGTAIAQSGYHLNLPGDTVDWDDNEQTQVINSVRNKDSYRYGATTCDSRTIGEKSYVVAPDQEKEDPQDIVWTHQECRVVPVNFMGNTVPKTRFVTLYDSEGPVTSPAYAREITVSRIDDYRRNVENLIGNESYSIGDYSEPTNEIDNLHELRFDFMTILPQTTSDELDDDPLIEVTGEIRNAIDSDVHALPENLEENNDSVNRRKQLIDARYAKMERRFHSEEDLSAAQAGAKQLSPGATSSVYAQLVNTASNFNCDLPAGYEPPVSESESEEESEVEEGELQITRFEAYRQRDFDEGIQLLWESNADTCQAQSSPTQVWGGEVPNIGATTVSHENSVSFNLTCTRDGESVNKTNGVPGVSDDFQIR